MKILLTTLNAKYIHKNLALRLIYAAKPEAANCEIKEFTIKEELEKIVNEIIEQDYELVGFSCYIWNIEPIMELVKALKARKPQLIIVLGGPEVSFDAVTYVERGVDAVVIGEGEFVFWEYVAMCETLQTYELAGVCTKEYPNHQYARAAIEQVETLDPYFMDFDRQEEGRRYFYFETSRGCPYNCSYCLSSTDRKVRLFSEDYIFAMLEKIANSSIKQVKLLDRTFNVDPKRALKIARYMNENCKNQIFQFEIVAETLSEELLEFFTNEADRERFRFEIGVQSFNEQSLEAVGRIQNSEKLMKVIQRMQDAQLTMHVDLIAGLPFEDYASFECTFNRLFAIRPEELQLGVLKLLKGTSLRLMDKVYGFTYEQYAPYTIEATKWVSEEELNAIKGAAYAVEKLYNSGKLKESIEWILTLGFYTSPFALFVDLGQRLSRLQSPYQVSEVFELVLDLLNEHDETLIQAIVMNDYNRMIKNKPKKLKGPELEYKVKKAYLHQFMEQFELSQNEVFKHCFVDYYYQGEITHQVVWLQSDQSFAKRYAFNKKKGVYEKIV